jgi:hypothetical protein
MKPADHAKMLRERGYAVLEGLYDAREVETLRTPITQRYREIGAPPTFARPPVEPASRVEVSVVGLVFHELGRHLPELAPRLFHPTVIETARAVLGEDAFLEYAAAVVNRDERPFFPWHAHMGGVDNVVYRKGGVFPRYAEPERITGLIYLDDLTEETGTLLVAPRAMDDPTAPPHDPNQEDWPEQVELACRRGTVVLLDQSTWHAARPMRRKGLRSFIAFYLTSPRAAPTSWVDRSFTPHCADAPLLASLLPPPDRGDDRSPSSAH